MRACSKCGTNFGLVNGIFQCPKCYKNKHMPAFRCQDCSKIFLHEFVKRPVECPYCKSFSTNILYISGG